MTDKDAKQTKAQFIIKIIIGCIFIAFCGLNITKPIFNFTNMPRILYNTVFILSIVSLFKGRSNNEGICIIKDNIKATNNWITKFTLFLKAIIFLPFKKSVKVIKIFIFFSS